jgi:hypothetical protein
LRYSSPLNVASVGSCPANEIPMLPMFIPIVMGSEVLAPTFDAGSAEIPKSSKMVLLEQASASDGGDIAQRGDVGGVVW